VGPAVVMWNVRYDAAPGRFTLRKRLPVAQQHRLRRIDPHCRGRAGRSAVRSAVRSM